MGTNENAVTWNDIQDECLTKPEESIKFANIITQWNEKKKKFIKDSNGITINGSIEEFKDKLLNSDEFKSKGPYVIKIFENNLNNLQDGMLFTFTIRNEKKEPIVITSCDTLNTLPNFQVWDYNRIRGCTHTENELKIKLKFTSDSTGEFRTHIGFGFKIVSGEKMFLIAREVIVFVIPAEKICKLSFGTIEQEESPFQGGKWLRINKIHPQGYKPEQRYNIPDEVNTLNMDVKPEEFYSKNFSKNPGVVTSLEQGCISNNYAKFFHYLLWIEERVAAINIESYNMKGVRVEIEEEDGVTCFRIRVPGLSEKRPSLIAGDVVYMKETEEEGWQNKSRQAYGGIIKEIDDEFVWIYRVDKRFEKRVSAYAGFLVDVKFERHRLNYVKMHNAVDTCFEPEIQKLHIIFPSNNEITNLSQQGRIKYKNKSIENNDEQKATINNILNRSSGNAPFIVYGPPGTGKTITIVEAILQIAEDEDSRILVCAPSNATCDMLVLKLSDYFVKKEMIRLHSSTYDWKLVPKKVREYSNRDDDLIRKIDSRSLRKYKIIVTTLMLIARHANAFSTTHVFIDEAAQAMEPEALIAIAGILKKDGQLVISGDFNQLGPSIASKITAFYKLEVSLLERLINNFPQYKPVEENSNYIIKLKKNYRSHEQIIFLPNRLFYKNELQAQSKAAKNDLLGKTNLSVDQNKRITPRAVEFYGVSGQERREGVAPSFYNHSEIGVIMTYVNELLGKKHKVKQSEIGIIAPYIRQVHRIRNCLEMNAIKGIEVGTTETFQGREKRVIIISTVRAKADLLLSGHLYDIGFVSHLKRFNVAITRAMSKLIVIGNPHVLCKDKTWNYLIRYCKKLSSYRGCSIVLRDDDTQTKIVQKLSVIEKK